MKKVILAFAAIVALSFSQANAQIQIGAFGTYNKLLGDAGTDAPAGFGGGLEGKYFINPSLALGASFGFIRHSETEAGITLSTTIMPILLTGNYFFTENGFRPYAGLGLGLYMLTFKSSGSVLGIPLEFETSESKTGFAPNAGFQYMFNDNLGLDVNLKYHYIMTEGEATTAFGANVGLVYNIGGKK